MHSLLLGWLAAGAAAGSARVWDLTDSTFEPFVETNPKALVLLYHSFNSSHPWLPAAFERLSAAPADLEWARLDLSHNPETAKMFEEVQLPAAVAYRDGEWVWQLARDGEAALATFVQRVSARPAHVPVLRTPDELAAARANCTLGIFYTVLHDYEAKGAVAMISLLADKYALPGFVVLPAAEPTPARRLLFRRNFDDGDKVFEREKGIDPIDVKRLVEAYHRRRCRAPDEVSLRNTFSYKRPTAFVFARSIEDPVVVGVERGIAQHKPDMQCSLVRPEDPRWGKLIDIFSIGAASLPFVGVLDPSGEETRLYGYPALREDSPEEFIAAYVQGAEPPFHRSEQVPTWQDPLVKRVVRNNFQAIVTDSARDTFLAFSDRWCVDCLTLFHRLKELAAQFPQVQFAIVDQQLNDIEGVEVKELPSFFLYKAGARSPPRQFRPPLNADALRAFLQGGAPSRAAEDDFDL